MMIRFEMNKDVTEIHKAIYSPFDLMRDLGGLLFLLTVIAGTLTYFMTYNKQANFLVG